MADGKNSKRGAGEAGESPSTSPRRAGSARRIAELEERVAQLERELALLRPPPAPVKEPEPRPGPRCPGCHLQVASIARGRCPWCGFVFDALVPLRRARRRSG